MKIRNWVICAIASILCGTAFATPAVVQQQAGSVGGGSGTSQTCTTTAFSAPVTSGNTVIISVIYGTAAGNSTLGTVSDDKSDSYTTDGNQLTTNANATGQGSAIIRASNVTAGPATFHVQINNATSTNFFIQCRAYEVSGLANSSPVDVALFSTSTSLAFAGPANRNISFTTTTAGEIGFAAVNASDATGFTENNGWTTDSATDITAHSILSSSGANSFQYSLTGSQEADTVVTYLPASGGTITHGVLTSGMHPVVSGTNPVYN